MVKRCIYELSRKESLFSDRLGGYGICDGCEFLIVEILKKRIVVQPSIYKEPGKEPIYKGKVEFEITQRDRIERGKDPEEDSIRDIIEVCRSAEGTEDDKYVILFKCRDTGWSYSKNLVEED
jgi:hypothetical protein